MGEAGTVGTIPLIWMCHAACTITHFPLLSFFRLSLFSWFQYPFVYLVTFSPQEINWPLTCLLRWPSFPHQPPNWGQLFTASMPDRESSHSGLAILACYLLFSCQFPTVCLPMPPAQHKLAFESGKLLFTLLREMCFWICNFLLPLITWTMIENEFINHY